MCWDGWCLTHGTLLCEGIGHSVICWVFCVGGRKMCAVHKDDGNAVHFMASCKIWVILANVVYCWSSTARCSNSSKRSGSLSAILSDLASHHKGTITEVSWLSLNFSRVLCISWRRLAVKVLMALKDSFVVQLFNEVLSLINFHLCCRQTVLYTWGANASPKVVSSDW